MVYSGFVILFGHLLPHRGKPLIADLAFVISTPIGITVAFLCYKHFVFRTKGNYLKEWIRLLRGVQCQLPNGACHPPDRDTPVAASSADSPVCAVPRQRIVNSLIIACYSYFAHKKFSFKR